MAIQAYKPFVFRLLGLPFALSHRAAYRRKRVIAGICSEHAVAVNAFTSQASQARQTRRRLC